MRILLVAPDHKELDIAREINGVVNSHAHSVHLLSGTVTEQDVERACAEDTYDIIWFASHGDLEGILLSNDEYLQVEALVPYIRAAGIRLVFINTCSSLELANQIAQESSADVICTIRSVLDRTAMRTGVLFAGQLAKGLSFRDAYENSKPGNNRVYLYITNQRSPRQEAKMTGSIVSEVPYSSSNGKQIDRLTIAVDELRKQVATLETRIAVLDSRVEALTAKLASNEFIHEPAVSWQTWVGMLAGAFIIAILGIILFMVAK